MSFGSSNFDMLLLCLNSTIHWICIGHPNIILACKTSDKSLLRTKIVQTAAPRPGNHLNSTHVYFWKGKQSGSALHIHISSNILSNAKSVSLALKIDRYANSMTQEI